MVIHLKGMIRLLFVGYHVGNACHAMFPYREFFELTFVIFPLHYFLRLSGCVWNVPLLCVHVICDMDNLPVSTSSVIWIICLCPRHL
jgi:hypothetical protein